MSWLRIALRTAIAGWVVTWGGIALRGADERVPLAHQQAPRPESAVPMFAHSDDCQACHNNLTSPAGEDVSIGVAWRGSIMANAARDPYFHASLRRELIDHPSAASEIEDECAGCHLPMAQRVAEASGARGEVFRWLPGAARASDSDLTALAQDGISCTVCHQISSAGLGSASSFNGRFTMMPPLADGGRAVIGPHAPEAGRKRVMHSVTGFEQTQAPHIRASELCATCHTLITQARGPDGRVIGSLPEQMNYQEWRHSAFDEAGRSCQSCHMPPVRGPVQIASVLGVDRESLGQHTFLGGNAFMLRLLNRYRAELGVTATPAELEATARATVRQLETATATVAIDRVEIASGTLVLDVRVTNRTGHKFPTGYPSRRTWLHVTVRDAAGTSIFESGGLRSTGAIDGNAADERDGTFEPHYAEITRPDQVQVYESIMGTVAGVATTGLLQATQYLKDNRLLPDGFDKLTAPAEIAVVGNAVQDADFSEAGDRVRYRVPASASGPLTVEVELRYQPIAYRWAQNLAAYSAPEPAAFLTYYNRLAPSSSVVVAQLTQVVAR